MDKIILRNSPIPCKPPPQRYSTFVDNQTAILINIYQGERELAKDCKLLGQFRLGGIPPMPAQMAQVDVTFQVDANGLLRVTAREQRSGQQATVTVQPSHGLSEQEVEKLVLESIEHAHEDFTARRLTELRNKADADLRHTDRGLARAEELLSAEQREKIESARGILTAAIAGTDVDVLQRAVSHFGDATLPLAELLMNAAVKETLAGTRLEEMKGGG